MYTFIFDSWDIFQAGYHKTGCKYTPPGASVWPELIQIASGEGESLSAQLNQII